MEKRSAQLYREREKRVNDAIQLKIPDRVPIVIAFSYFPAKYAGITCEDAFYSSEKWKMAMIKTIVDFEPDMCFMTRPLSGAALEAFDFKQIVWPGHGVSPDHTHQYVEGEYMKADEYDAFLEDPSDFIVRTFLPRISGNLESLTMLPPLSRLLFGETTLTATIGIPELTRAFESLLKARQEVLKWNPEMDSLDAEMVQLGFPPFSQSVTFTPFDVISDRLRGMRGSMLDMYRQPDKLIKACEKLLPLTIQMPIVSAKKRGNPRVFIPLHRGAEGFMSPEQFATFYWPTLKRLIIALVDEGLTPCPFFEGDYTSRLKYLLELPKGKILGHFDTSDILKTKEVVGSHICIRGNVPSSLLQTGTPQEVKDYCKKLIDNVGKGGGFIMSPRSSIDEANPENIKAMFDFTKEYGIYS